MGLLVSTLLATRLAAQPVTILLRNGDRLTGTVLGETNNQVTFKTTWWNVVVIPTTEIQKREVASPPSVTVAPVSPPLVAGAPMAEPAPKAKVKHWSGEASVGVDLLFSERNRQLYTGRFKLGYARNRFVNLLDYSIAYGKTDGLLSDDRMFGTDKADLDIKGPLYLYNLAGAGFDRVRKIDLRIEAGPGVGYHWLRRTNVVLNTEVGFNYQAQYQSDETQTESVYMRWAENLAWTLSPRIAFDEKLEFFPRVDNWEEYRARFEANLRYALWTNLALILTVLDQYDSRPATGVPQNDLQVRSSIGVRF